MVNELVAHELKISAGTEGGVFGYLWLGNWQTTLTRRAEYSKSRTPQLTAPRAINSSFPAPFEDSSLVGYMSYVRCHSMIGRT